jgi:hypothetical protein
VRYSFPDTDYESGGRQDTAGTTRDVYHGALCGQDISAKLLELHCCYLSYSMNLALAVRRYQLPPHPGSEKPALQGGG